MDIKAIEIFGNNVKIEYADGSREEVENDFFERKDTEGDTVEERQATQLDVDRLMALAAAFETANPPSTSAIVEIEVVGDNIEIKYADGTKEEISGGIYERKNADNETIIERAVTEEDLARLTDLAAGDIAPAPGDDDGTPDQGPGDAPGTPGADDGNSPDDDGTPDQGSGDDDSAGDRSAEIVGTDDDDRIRGTSADEIIDGLEGNDRLRGRAGDDVVNGGDGNDRVRGDEGNDIVNGGNGNDRVIGNLGDDILNGNAGSDRYNGGLGADTFVFDADGAFDKINDFEDGTDLIDISSFGIADVNALLAEALQGIDFVRLDLGGGDVIQIDDIAVAQLSSEDFIL